MNRKWEDKPLCRFCQRQFEMNDWGRIIDHIALDHPDEYDKIMDDTLKNTTDWICFEK